MPRGFKSGDRSAWIVGVCLGAGVLLPTGALLWFMNETMRSQEEAARRRVEQAYRGQLRLMRDRLNAAWQARAARIDEAAGDFPRALAASGADTLLLLSDSGQVRYPVPGMPLRADRVLERAGWQAAARLERDRNFAAAAALWLRMADSEKDSSIAARAASAGIRCLLRSGQKEPAIAEIAKRFAGSRATDVDGRLIAADEQLLAIQLMNRSEQRFAVAVRRLADVLSRYDGPKMPSAQRLFLMKELRVAAPELPAFPTQAAEQMALAFVESGDVRVDQPGLRAAGANDLWTLTTPGRRAVALYRTRAVVEVSRAALAAEGSSSGVEFSVSPPGGDAPGDGIAIGAMLPGWQIWTLPGDGGFDPGARRRMTYLWVGYLVIAGIVLGGIILGQTVRRQFRLARMKADLVATVSHELKTPLASMRLLVELLLNDKNVSPRTAREYLEMIAGESARLTRVIENFLQFSRIERNRPRFDLKKTSVADVIHAAVALWRERLSAPGCRLELEIESDLPAVYADQEALVTVLVNLLDNAYKYTPEEKRLGLAAYSEAGDVYIAVKDNGIGIEGREQKRIFRRFYQVDRRLAREVGGCGLGLSIVDFIVRAHGGEVRVHSALGKGSTFCVRLPAAPVSVSAGVAN